MDSARNAGAHHRPLESHAGQPARRLLQYLARMCDQNAKQGRAGCIVTTYGNGCIMPVRTCWPVLVVWPSTGCGSVMVANVDGGTVQAANGS